MHILWHILWRRAADFPTTPTHPHTLTPSLPLPHPATCVRTELLPNTTFWVAVFGLIKDGCSFTFNKVTGKSGASSAYSSI